MATIAPLANPPIREAVLDIRIEPNLSLDEVAIFADIKESLPFPVKEVHEQYGFETLFQIENLNAIKQTSFDPRKEGYRYFAENDHDLFQVQTGGMAYNRLGEYPNWPAFIATAKECWDVYRNHVGEAKNTSRIALRYINIFDVPLDSVEDFILYKPQVPSSLFEAKHAIIGFDYHTDLIHNSYSDLRAKIRFTIEEIGEKTIKFLLDIDAYRIMQKGIKDLSLIEDFDIIHSFKNEIFFSFITEKQKELYL